MNDLEQRLKAAGPYKKTESDLQTRVETMEKQVADMTKSIESITTQLGALLGCIQKNQADVEELKGNLDRLVTYVTA
jgi:chaperonin cofactor prefoldin